MLTVARGTVFIPEERSSGRSNENPRASDVTPTSGAPPASNSGPEAKSSGNIRALGITSTVIKGQTANGGGARPPGVLARYFMED